ncbi:MAG: hypothetical protein R3360_00655 [Alphaproteobacteria bacterium]|nr:hypothetical protein [Alphaproteobacteria bacterium]
MTLTARHLRLTAFSLLLGLSLSGCETLDSINPFSGGGDDLYIDNDDDAPLTEETGALPADRQNATYSDEELRPEMP